MCELSASVAWLKETYAVQFSSVQFSQSMQIPRKGLIKYIKKIFPIDLVPLLSEWVTCEAWGGGGVPSRILVPALRAFGSGGAWLCPSLPGHGPCGQIMLPDKLATVPTATTVTTAAIVTAASLLLVLVGAAPVSPFSLPHSQGTGFQGQSRSGR